MATAKKTTKKSRSKPSRQPISSEKEPSAALVRLIDSLQELHRWQGKLLREASQEAKHLANAAGKVQRSAKKNK